jgi:glycosyltransferase involved in cell wall biosynthesis
MEARFEGVPHVILSSSLRNLTKSVRSVVNLVSEKSIDSVFFLSGGSTVLGELVLLYCRLTGRKGTALFYGKDLLQYKEKRFNVVLPLATIVLARRIAVNSRFTMSLLPIRPWHSTTILYPIVDPSLTLHQSSKLDEHDRPRILFVGRLVKRKGLDNLLLACRNLKEDAQDFELRVVGDGPEREHLTELSERLQLTEEVKFLGELRGSPLAYEYANSAFLVLPSIQTRGDVEGFGTVFLEAAMFGKTAVGTMSGGIGDAIVPEKTGLLVPPGDVASLQKAMLRLLRDPAERERLGEAAKQRATVEFSNEMAMKRFFELFK